LALIYLSRHQTTKLKPLRFGREMKPTVNQKDNPLFTNGENFQMNACVGDNGGPYGLFDYGKGFFEAGHAVVKAARETVAPVDLLVYPAAFSYRHGIELLLKELILLLNRVLETGDEFKKNHKMIELWSNVAKLTSAMPEKLIEQEAIARVGELIGHFDAFDPTGQVFRYPEDIKGNRHLAEHKLINVEVLQQQMQELQNILERWCCQVAEYRDWQLERQAEANSSVS